ncbi:hypothetical protein [Bradyrhizobium sp. SSUT18]|uniref:hypothetical protein n=1 Tax=Bradyrhizobium sp. SSUT18 TaxID=3040602 RepID=UPI0032637526
MPRSIDIGVPTNQGEATAVDLLLLVMFAIQHSMMARVIFKQWCDCPTSYASSHDRKSGSFDRTPILLGLMSAGIEARPRLRETLRHHCLGGRPRRAETRCRGPAYGEAGTLLAVARATWIAKCSSGAPEACAGPIEAEHHQVSG